MAHTLPALVAERLRDLLWSFPLAAISGVQWQTLARKYQERHGSRLDLASLGYGSALDAAGGLLQDVLRVVEMEDIDNPVVALEDMLVLAPRPGSLASWPSLYHALCAVVTEHGSPGAAEEHDSVAHELLFSQLKPLLQRHWHSSFDEGSLSYFTEEGSSVKLKKLKHLLQAVLRWRDQRMSWQAEAGLQDPMMHEALRPRLELVPSSRHNDLLLRCLQPRACDLGMSTSSPVVPRPCTEFSADSSPRDCAESDTTDTVSLNSVSLSSHGSKSFSEDCVLGCSIEDQRGFTSEIASLRAENERLRCRNLVLEHCTQDVALRAELFGTPTRPDSMRLMTEVFDDPFEPPPEARAASCLWGLSPASTATPGSFCLSAGSVTPLSEAASGQLSGSATPARLGAGNPVCALLPVWFAMGDRVKIPSGVVEQARAVFERGDASGLPSFFARQ